MFKEGNKCTYKIMGDPIALARCRFNTNKRGCYNPQKSLRHVFSATMKEQHGRLALFSGPIHMDIVFYIAIPAGYGKTKIPRMHATPHIFKPDLSNLLKFLEDAGSGGIIYKDDCIIYSITMKKLYDDGAGTRTEFTVTEHIYEKEKQ